MRLLAVVVVGASATLGAASFFSCGGSLTDLGDGSVDGADESTIADARADVSSGPCSANEVLCGTTCYANDVDHCGLICAKCGAPANGVATCDGTSCGFKCNTLQCGNACVDSTTDTHNCGGCGHDCLGSSCVSGACVPDQVFPGIYTTVLAVDSANLYWAKSSGATGEIDKGPKGGGNWAAIATGINTTNVGISGIAVDANNVYWAQQGAIGYVPIGGGTVSGYPTSTQYPVGPALGPASLYYASGTSNPVYSVAYDAGTSIPTVTSSGPVNALVYANGYVFFTGYTGGYVETVSRFSPANVDAGVEQLFTADAGSTATTGPFAVDPSAANVYFGINSSLWTLPLDGGTPTSLSSQTGPFEGAVADGVNVYWATANGVYRTPVGGTITTTLFAASAGAVNAVTMDAQYVYWTYVGNSSGTGIYRVAK